MMEKDSISLAWTRRLENLGMQTFSPIDCFDREHELTQAHDYVIDRWNLVKDTNKNGPVSKGIILQRSNTVWISMISF